MVYPSVSQVLLINDQSSGVGAILEKTRLQGVLRGTANGEVSLERVMSDEEVGVGETILTSGGDQIFPKGLPVGTVAKVGKGKDLFLNIKIRTAADLSKLEEVLVLVEKQERQSTADENVRVRAADILAQRLPSVPDKAAVAPAATVAGAPAAAGANPAPKPKSPAASTGIPAQNANSVPGKTTQAAATGTQPAKTATQSATVAKPKTAVQPSAQPAPKNPVDASAAKPETSRPSITEDKPANPPAIQPVPQTPPDPNNPN
jgi:rod shape-determining protein MreC